MTNRMTNLPVPFAFTMAVTTAGTPEILAVKIRANTIAFVTAAAPARSTITDSGNGFLIAGFQPGDTITVSGSSSNDGVYVVDDVAAGTLTLNKKHTLVTEGAAATVKITAPKTIPDGVSMVIKAKYANAGTVCVSNSSARALNSTTGHFKLRNNESLSLQVNSTDQVWLDVSSSGEGVECIFEKNPQTL